jgi:arylsulfatase A-like enzyme
MIVRWPGRIAAGQTSALPWAQWDLMATLADLAGAPAPTHTDGISVVPTLLGRPEDQASREYLYWEYQQGKQQAVRMVKWKAVRVGGTEEPIELYDLTNDPGESRNLANDHPEIIENMRRIMVEARQGSEFTKYWKFPERRRADLKFDQIIYKNIKNGIRH